MINTLSTAVLRIITFVLNWTFPTCLLAATIYTAYTCEVENCLFFIFFLYKYPRAIFHEYAYRLWSHPAPVPKNPTILPSDVTVIIPTVDPQNEDFEECITTVLANRPGAVLIVTVGQRMLETLEAIVAPWRERFPESCVKTCMIDEPNKRLQICAVLPSVNTKLTVLLDDHVFWPSTNFLKTVIAPFENPEIGGVGTVKKVRRTAPGHFNWTAFWNFLGCVYLERHNFEIQATNAIDQGVFVISGRTAIYRTCILAKPSFIHAFCNDMFFFNIFGPLNTDDDNFITRELVKAGWKIKIQNHPDAFIETTVGTYPRFIDQCKRWARTTWRSNSASMFTDDGSTWWKHPWLTWGVFVYTCFNFSAIIEIGLAYGLYSSTWWASATTSGCIWMALGLVVWVWAFKMQKLLQFFIEHPKDIFMFFPYLIWTWYHSYIKALSCVTFFNVAWGGRNLAQLTEDEKKDAAAAAANKKNDPRARSVARATLKGMYLMPAQISQAASLNAENTVATKYIELPVIPNVVVLSRVGSLETYNWFAVML